MHRQWSVFADVWVKLWISSLTLWITLWRHVSPSIDYKNSNSTSWDRECQRAAERRYALDIYTKHAEFLPSVQLRFLAPSLAFCQVLLCSAFSSSVGLLADSAFTLFKAETIQLAHDQGFSWWQLTYVLWFLKHTSRKHLKIWPQNLNSAGLLNIPML